uniref:Nuclear receptor binding factor 2b n=1 Tax=Cyprinus carpio carpio TaxID=630221 RepID=A0A9J8BJU9_CYPCA
MKEWRCWTVLSISPINSAGKQSACWLLGNLKMPSPATEKLQARLSLELQRDSHIKQQRLIEEQWKRAKREDKPRTLQHVQASDQTPRRDLQPGRTTMDVSQPSEREYDTWLYLLKNKGTVPEPCAGSKAQKDDKTRLEEQQTTIDDLRDLVDRLVCENEQLKRENEQLRAENARLKKEPYADADFVERSELWVLPRTTEERKAKDIPIPQLPPLEMPTQEIPLEDLPGLELPEDIQQELQELLDREKL